MKILCIVGATGTGKNHLALSLAKKFEGEIVNFDSRQVYRDFPIITAQPSSKEKRICPHHLYGFLDSREKINAGEFAELAHKCLISICEKGKLPILVGGTGLYLKAILQGLAPIPPIEKKIRQRVIEEYLREGGERMWLRLKEVDPEYALKIHPRDKQRITRALEVYISTGKPFSWFHKKLTPPTRKYSSLKIGLYIELTSLKERLAKRIDKMIQEGGIEEVKKIWEKYPKKDDLIWSAIGCKEIIAYLEGKLSLEETKKLWLKNTKAYAKRQITWFKRDQEIHWIEGEEEIENTEKKVEKFLEGPN